MSVGAGREPGFSASDAIMGSPRVIQSLRRGERCRNNEESLHELTQVWKPESPGSGNRTGAAFSAGSRMGFSLTFELLQKPVGTLDLLLHLFREGKASVTAILSATGMNTE